MNSHQMRKRARQFVAEVVKMLPAEYDRERTAIMIEQERRIAVLENQLMRRDGYVIHHVDEHS
jgi:hypothetical protein